jgi:DNA repair protein SbcD/Mre11
MKFLQTGDWHLGKIFHETSLIEDQKVFLSQITGEQEKAGKAGAPYDALIVPGDIYDRSVPPAEAVTLLSSFLTATHASFPDLHIFLLAGNHDSPDRLSFAAQILSTENIHICTDVSQLTEPVIVGTGKNAAAVYQIPYLHPGEIQTVKTDAAGISTAGSGSGQQDLFADSGTEDVHILRSQQELTSEAAARISAAHNSKYAGLPSVVCAHLFTLAAHVSDSERISVGTAEQVDADIFSPFSYTALGHLHGLQRAGKKANVWYSGAPLAYSFDDSSDTFMLSVTVEKDDVKEKIEVSRIQIAPLHAVVRLTGPFDRFYGESADMPLIEKNAENYVEIICTDTAVPENPMTLLRRNFHNILSFKKQETTAGAVSIAMQKRREIIESDSADKPDKLFEMFIQDVYGGNIPVNDDFLHERQLFLKFAAHYSWTED